MFSTLLVGAVLGVSVLSFSGVPSIQQSIIVVSEELHSPSEIVNLDVVTKTIVDKAEDLTKEKEVVPVRQKEYITETNYDFINILGTVSKDNFDLMLSYYCAIPLALREEFQNSSWVLSMTDERLEDTWFIYMTVPVCAGSDYMLQEIRMEDSVAGAKAVIHEFGHYYSWTHGNLYYTTEFQNLYALEGASVSNYAGTSADECFAESFDMYIRNPSALSQNAPSIYAYFQNLLG